MLSTPIESISTVEGSNNYPCNAISGLRAGEACAFPFWYPDCKLLKTSSLCAKNPGRAPMLFNSCSSEATDNMWCSTKNYRNRSHITGEWGYCSSACSSETVRSDYPVLSEYHKPSLSSDNPQYNLASELYSSRWEEGVYRLFETGHCHTFHPENVDLVHSDTSLLASLQVSLSGLKGQHSFHLGLVVRGSKSSLKLIVQPMTTSL